MRKTRVIVAVASLSIYGLLIPATLLRADPPIPDANAKVAPVDKVSDPMSNLPEADTRAIEHTLAVAVDHAVTPGGSHELMLSLSKADQERLSKEKLDYGDLNVVTTSFQNDWKAKYGADFKLEGNEDVVFKNVRLQAGQSCDNAQTASAKLAPANDPTNPPRVQNSVQSQQGATGAESLIQGTPGRPTPPDATTPPQKSTAAIGTMANQGSAQLAGQRLEAATNGVNAALAGSPDYATVTFPVPDQAKNPNAKPLMIDLVREDGSWHVVLPPQETHEQLHDALMGHINRIESMKDKWPENADRADAIVARLMLRSFSATTTTNTGSNGNTPPAPRQ